MVPKWTGQTIRWISLHKRRVNPMNYGYGLEHLPFLILYSYVLYHCFLTIGEPYATAIEALKESGQLTCIPQNIDRDGNLAGSALSGGLVREELSTSECTLPDREEGDGPPLPNPYLPAIVPLLGLLGTLCLHILMMLLQVWFVSVLTLIKYRPSNSLEDATFVQVTPKSYRGKSCLIPIEQHVLSDGTISAKFFMFQKRKYVAEQLLENGEASVIFRKLKSPSKEPLKKYIGERGFKTATDYMQSLDLYGKNVFHIPQPTFMEMYKQQLLEPLTVFQIFSVFLWILDEYWQYPLFTLAMILLFEGVTVFSRLKNLSTLRGMGNETRDIFVYRFGSWKKVSSEMLVPGDLISLRREKEGDTVVPCDGLLLRGCAVTNEATLTGESVPQMKEAIGNKLSEDDLRAPLDMKTAHKVHILFGGTKIMQHDLSNVAPDGDEDTSLFPKTPDDGCLVYVLRTGFIASQGKLVRMIEYSSGKVTGSTWDALGLALMLLVFAIMSSTYVLKHGIEEKGKLTFELALRCVLIITSVIPAELPMQTALAVNSALLTLVKLAIFCTEPFRIALAGKVDVCLFDKTGTITTDQLTAVGIAGWDPESESQSVGNSNLTRMKPMIASNVDASIVIGGCHSLVQVDGKLIGDPVEEASLRAIDFTFDPHTRRSTPNKGSQKASERTWSTQVDTSRVSVEILHRNHFASKLQRMSVLARVNTGIGKSRLRSLVKGSPEAISQLLSSSPNAIPSWYWDTYKSMAKDGMRVLALAYRDIEPGLNEAELLHQPRSWAESNLIFAGFAAFRCLVRRDSADVLKMLKDSSHAISMITGDAMLTAIHVAREVSIITKPCLNLIETSEGGIEWKETDGEEQTIQFSTNDIPRIVRKYDLCVSGKTLLTFSEIDRDIWKYMDSIRVFARMTPELKERVITYLKKNGHHPLMCGDGANDVGALKQADIGVALLSGFGSANADKVGAKNSKMQKKEIKTVHREALAKLHVSVLKKKLGALNVDFRHCREKKELVELLVKSQGEPLTSSKKLTERKKKTLSDKNPLEMTAEEKKQLIQKKQEELEADVRAREQRGESFARIRAFIAMTKRETEDAKKKAKARGGFAARTNNAIMNQYMEDFEDGDVPMVKLGDASIASPFTSRAPSIKATVDIIRQGRCALVTTMQMYQILAVNCLISSYSLSVLYLDEVKYGNQQMIALGMISTIASLTLSRATPLNELSPVRPLTSIFHPALFLSLVGQFSIHLICMIYSTNLAKEYTREGDVRHKAGGEFQPNVMSTVVFLVNAVQTVSVCAVNYKGRPFMKGMADNPGLLYSLGGSLIGVILCLSEAMPLFNKLVQIVPLPDPVFAQKLIATLIIDVIGSFVWDQLCLGFFAPQILWACIKSNTAADIRKFLKMGAITMLLIYFFANVDYEELERQRIAMEEAATNNTSA